jgi:hypothetical protein
MVYYKKHVFILFAFLCLIPHTYGQVRFKNKTTYEIKEKLNVPFGTIVEMKIEIIDSSGKGRNHYFMKIKKIEGRRLLKPIIMDFHDKTGKFPRTHFELYEYLYGEKVGMLTSTMIDTMTKSYIGKTFKILAFETGDFIGLPFNYLDFTESGSVQSSYFHFRNYIYISGGI